MLAEDFFKKLKANKPIGWPIMEHKLTRSERYMIKKLGLPRYFLWEGNICYFLSPSRSLKNSLFPYKGMKEVQK